MKYIKIVRLKSLQKGDYLRVKTLTNIHILTDLVQCSFCFLPPKISEFDLLGTFSAVRVNMPKVVVKAIKPEASKILHL